MSNDKASATLQKQFETLQEQQAQKLARRQKRAEERGRTFVNPPSNGPSSSRSQVSSATSAAFGVDDDLGLKFSPAAPHQNYGYGEEQQGLKEQNRELKDESGRLYKLLSERDLEIRQFKKKLEQQRQLLESAGSGTNETAALKIVELSKKVRELTSEVESEKTKCKQWAKKCMDLENEKQSGDLGTGRGRGNTSARTGNDRGDSKTKDWEAELKALQQKYNQSEQRCAEQRNQIQQAKQELKMAQKALANEVGEGVTVQSLLNTPSGWRGRTQQILALQKKVTELKAQLQASNMSTADSVLDDDMDSTIMGSTTTRHRTANDAHREQIRQMDRERKESQERMVNELRALEQDFEATKTKMEAAKARNKVLSGENKTVKAQMATLLEKGKHDDELISALMKQQGQLQTMMKDAGKTDAAGKAEYEKKLKEAELKAQQDVNKISMLQTIVNEKEATIHKLEEETEKLRLTNLQRAQEAGVTALFERAASRASSVASNRAGPPIDSLEITSPSPTPSSRSAEALVGPASTNGGVPIVGPITLRQSDRPVSTHSDRPSSRKQSARDHPTNSSGDPGVPQISGLELQELHAQIQQYKSLCQAAEVERDKLAELVRVLEKRVSDLTTQISEAQQEAQAQKRRSVVLEKQLGKAKVEQQSTGRTSGKRSSRMRGSTATLHDLIEDEASTAANMEELQTRLEIQEDENAALKAALQSTLKAKEDDLQLYQEIMDQTKAVFLQGLRQFRAQ